jgi:hypothetical protein
MRPLHTFATIKIRLCHVVKDHTKSSIRPGSVKPPSHFLTTSNHVLENVVRTQEELAGRRKNAVETDLDVAWSSWS